jgi:hypothetical protein
MKRIIRLTESDLARIVKRVMNEAPTDANQGQVAVKETGVDKLMGPGETINGYGRVISFGTKPGLITNATVAVTPEGAKLGLTNDMLKIQVPVRMGFVIPAVKNEHKVTLSPAKYSNPKLEGMWIGHDVSSPKVFGGEEIYKFTFTGPRKRFVNDTGRNLILYTVTFDTNDTTKPIQTKNFVMRIGAQFGTSNVAGSAN